LIPPVKHVEELGVSFRIPSNVTFIMDGVSPDIDHYWELYLTKWLAHEMELAEYTPPPGALRVQGELSMSLISFEAVIEDSIPVTLLLDTGAGGSLHLTRTFMESRGGELTERPYRESRVEAVGGSGTVRLLQVESLTLAGATIPCGEASVFDDTGPLSRYDGILGSGILSRYTLVLDYSMPGFHLITHGSNPVR